MSPAWLKTVEREIPTLGEPRVSIQVSCCCSGMAKQGRRLLLLLVGRGIRQRQLDWLTVVFQQAIQAGTNQLQLIRRDVQIGGQIRVPLVSVYRYQRALLCWVIVAHRIFFSFWRLPKRGKFSNANAWRGSELILLVIGFVVSILWGG